MLYFGDTAPEPPDIRPEMILFPWGVAVRGEIEAPEIIGVGTLWKSSNM